MPRCAVEITYLWWIDIDNQIDFSDATIVAIRYEDVTSSWVESNTFNIVESGRQRNSSVARITGAANAGNGLENIKRWVIEEYLITGCDENLPIGCAKRVTAQ